MFEQPYDTLNWICEKSEHKLAYYRLRDGRLFQHKDSKLLNACIELSGILRDETDVVRRLIHHHDWRNQVIGNIVVVLNRDNRYEEDLVAKLKKGVHFPSPLSAGWLIINTGETIPDMEAFLIEMSKDSDMSHDSTNYGVALAVYAALRILDSPQAAMFERTAFFQVLLESNFYPHTVELTEANYSAYMSFTPTP